MSNLLNHKEEVLKVEMTKHGRMLYGMGLFKPSYFSFFDDSVIYDNSYTGLIDEDKNIIQDRILYNSITFSSLDLISKTKQNILGKSDPFSDDAPAWELHALNGKMTYKPENSSYYKKNFKLDNLNCNISFKNSNEPSNDIIIESDYILLDLSELNVDDDIKNFEVEMLYIDPLMSGSTKAIEKKLFFTSENNNIIDDIIYDEEELPSKYYDVNFDEKYCYYFFDLLVDEEIDTEYIRNAGTNTYSIVKGLVSSVPDYLRRSFGLGDDNFNNGAAGGRNGVGDGDPNSSGLNKNPMPGKKGDKITLGKDGQILSIDSKDPSYSGNVCTLTCCP